MKQEIYKEEVTLKELILIVQEYFWEIIRNWIWVILIPIPIVAYMLYGDYKSPETYTSELTFMMNDEKGGGLGSLGGLAASFGIGGGGGDYNLEKMHSLLKSRNIIQQTLFEKVEINGVKDFYANHFIKEYNYHDDWEKELLNFLFTNSNTDEFSRVDNKALKQIYGLLVGSSKKPGILSSDINEDTNIMEMNLESTSEELSIKFIKSLFDKLSTFYIEKTIEKPKRTLEITKNKVDSLRSAMDYAQNRLLKIKDSQRNLTLRQYEGEALRLERQAQVLIAVYGEALKNQEIADFALKSKTPFIQAIDMPIPPLSPNKTIMTYIKTIIIGGFIGGFIAIVFIIGRKIYRDTMK